MVVIDFNNNFKGFQKKEDILVDSGVLYAYLNEHDAWHSTVFQLFDNHILNNPDALFLYINPCILTEVTNLLDWEKSIHRYSERHPELGLTKDQLIRVEHIATAQIKKLIENEVLLVLDLNKDSVLHQLSIFKKYGSTDAANIALINQYGCSLLTVDNVLVEKLCANTADIPNVPNIYHTKNHHRTY